MYESKIKVEDSSSSRPNGRGTSDKASTNGKNKASKGKEKIRKTPPRKLIYGAL